MDNFVIYRLDKKEVFINYYSNGIYDKGGNEVGAGDYRVTENKSFKCCELGRGRFNVKNNEFSMNDDLKIVNISLKSFLTLENFDVGDATDAKIIHVIFKSNNNITLTIEVNGVNKDISLNSDKILRDHNLLIKEAGVYKFKVNNIFLEIANTKEFKANKKDKYSVLKGNISPVINLNDTFISIVRNKEYYKKSFNFSDTDNTLRNHDKIINYLSVNNYKEVLPLVPYNKADSSFEKPLTVLLLKNENIELDFFHDFLDKAKIKNMTINKPSLTEKNCYTANDVICNVIFTFEIKEENTLNGRYGEIVSLIAKENNNRNVEVGKEYTLTFDLCFTGDSEKKFYSLIEIANDNNDYFIHTDVFSCKETDSSLKYTFNMDMYDDNRYEGVFTHYLNFTKDYVLGLLVESSEQEYKSGLRG